MLLFIMQQLLLTIYKKRFQVKTKPYEMIWDAKLKLRIEINRMLLKFDFGRIRKQEHLIWLIAAESLDFIFLIS